MDSGSDFFGSDRSEGTDNLYQPVGPIAKAQELAAHLFGAEATYFG